MIYFRKRYSMNTYRSSIVATIVTLDKKKSFSSLQIILINLDLLTKYLLVAYLAKAN